jgi:hypothetical protein
MCHTVSEPSIAKDYLVHTSGEAASLSHVGTDTKPVGDFTAQSDEPTSDMGLTEFMRLRRVRSARYPARFPRKVSDTNRDSFAGKTLMIRREGLSVIGRVFDFSKSTNSCVQPWRV